MAEVHLQVELPEDNPRLGFPELEIALCPGELAQMSAITVTAISTMPLEASIWKNSWNGRTICRIGGSRKPTPVSKRCCKLSSAMWFSFTAPTK